MVDDLEPYFPELSGMPRIRAYRLSLYAFGKAMRPMNPVLYGLSVRRAARVGGC